MEEKSREETYRYYVAKSLQLQPQRKWLEYDFMDIIERRIDTRTADKIVADITEQAGLTIKE